MINFRDYMKNFIGLIKALTNLLIAVSLLLFMIGRF